MPDVQQLPFEPWHLDACEFDEFHETHMNKDEVKSVATNSPGFTVMVDGKATAVAGFFEIEDQVINVWVIPTIYFKPFRFSTIKVLKQFLSALVAQGFKRIQTIGYVDEAHPRWMEYIGFRCEGMEFSVGGLTYKMWSVVM